MRAGHHQQQPLRPGRARLRLRQRRAGGHQHGRRELAPPQPAGRQQPHAPGARHRVRRPAASTTRPRSSTSTRAPTTAGRTCSRPRARLLQRGHRQALRHRRPALLGGAQVQREPRRSRRARRTPSSSRTADDINVPESEQPDSPLRVVAAGLRPALRLRPHQRQRGRRGHPRRQDPARRRHHLAHLVQRALPGSGHGPRSTSWGASRPSAPPRSTTWSQWAPGVQPLDGDLQERDRRQ